MPTIKGFRKSLRKTKKMMGGSKTASRGSKRSATACASATAYAGGRSPLSKTAKSVSSKKVAATEARAVIQAKEAIQDAMLNKNPDEQEIFDRWVEESARNADELLRHNRFRKWREELYIRPTLHKNGGQSDWYRNMRATQWEYHGNGNSNNKIPRWAQSGRRHPDEGELVEGVVHNMGKHQGR
jgi:hypothetical protein